MDRVDRGRPTASETAVLAAAVRASRRILLGAAAAGLAIRLAPLPADDGAALVLGAAAVGLLVGLPHGAIDHVLAARMTGWPLAPAAAGYGAVALLVWLALVLGGPLALAAVLGLSLLHFALGEWEVLTAVTGWHPSRPVAWATALAGTGALLLPLARVGAPLHDVAEAVAPGLGDLLAQDAVRLALAAGWLVAALVAVVAAARARRWSVVADVAVLAAVGVLVPPLAAFAVWFGCWHGLRHLGRLLALEPGAAGRLAAGDTRGAVRHLAGIAAGPTLAALAVAGLLVARTVTDADPTAALGGALQVLLALTVPHMLVVLWVDLQRWRTPRGVDTPRRTSSVLRPR